jgi:hypothetical protein
MGIPNEKEMGWQVFRKYNVHVGRARRSHVTEIPQHSSLVLG